MHRTLLFFVLTISTPLLAQPPAIVLEVYDRTSDQIPAIDPNAPAYRFEQLSFIFAGPEQITRDITTEAQVTVFDLDSHTIILQTPIYLVDGQTLDPGPNYTIHFELRLHTAAGVLNALIGAGPIELVVPIEPARWHRRPIRPPR